MELKDIRAIIDLMKKNDLAVFTLEKEGMKLHLESKVPQVITTAVPQTITTPVAAPIVSSGVTTTQPPPTASAVDPGKEIKSPMVGTFYCASSPDAKSYVEVGQEVSEDTVVCIIEAMKVMNEIKAEVSGTISEVLVENGTAVQFGQPLFRLK